MGWVLHGASPIDLITVATMAHHQRSEYERNSEDEEVVGDSGSVSRVRRACMATSQDPDEEVEGDSGRIPVYLRMAMEYPDDGE